MKKYIINALLFITLCTVLIGCGKSNDNTNKISEEEYNKIVQEEINKVNEQLLKDNVSLDGGHLLVPSDVDLTNDDVEFNKYAYINNEKIDFPQTNYVVTNLLGFDEEQNTYSYSFFTNTKDIKVVDYFLLNYVSAVNEDSTMELIYLSDTMYTELDSIPVVLKEMTIGNELSQTTFYMIALQLTNSDDTLNTFLVATFATSGNVRLEYQDVLEKLYSNVTFEYQI